MHANPITVAIVDEHYLFRRLLCEFLGRREDIQVVFDGGCLSDLFKGQGELNFDILITDASIYQKSTREELLRLRALYPAASILLLSVITDIRWVNGLLEMGIRGCISKQDDPEELLSAIFVVASGKLYRSFLFTEMLYHHQQHSSSTSEGSTQHLLSEREKALLKLLWEEKNNIEIAKEISLSVRSVEKMKQDLRGKLQVRSVTGLLRYALERGLYTVDATF